MVAAPSAFFLAENLQYLSLVRESRGLIIDSIEFNVFGMLPE